MDDSIGFLVYVATVLAVIVFVGLLKHWLTKAGKVNGDAAGGMQGMLMLALTVSVGGALRFGYGLHVFIHQFAFFVVCGALASSIYMFFGPPFGFRKR